MALLSMVSMEDLLSLVVARISNISHILNRNKLKSGMNLFYNSKVVKLRSMGKYLLANDDQESVVLGRNGSSNNAKWTVEFMPGCNTNVRLKSCYGKYLTASEESFLGGMTGLKVLQTEPEHLDSSVGWEPTRDGDDHVVRLKNGYSNKFLRADDGVPPWKNSMTHKTPLATFSDNYAWHVDIVEKLDQSAAAEPSTPSLDILLLESSSHESSSSSGQEGYVKLKEFIRETMRWMNDNGLRLILLLLVLVLVILVVLLFSIIVALVLVFRSQINDVKLKCQSIITNMKETVLGMRNHKFLNFLLKMLFVYVLLYAVFACSLCIWHSNRLH